LPCGASTRYGACRMGGEANGRDWSKGVVISSTYQLWCGCNHTPRSAISAQNNSPSGRLPWQRIVPCKRSFKHCRGKQCQVEQCLVTQCRAKQCQVTQSRVSQCRVTRCHTKQRIGRQIHRSPPHSLPHLQRLPAISCDPANIQRISAGLTDVARRHQT